MLVLSATDVEKLLPMAEAIAAVETGFRLLGQGKLNIPDRLHIPVDPKATWLIMPAISMQEPPWMGVKLVSVFPDNCEKSLDIVQACYLLQDGRTGETKALMDATSLTAIRTPATSAVATRYLAPGKSHVLGIIGTGVQARGHLVAMCAVAPIREVLICGQTPGESEEFVSSNKAPIGTRLRSAYPEELVTRSDIICTCTTSTTPVFSGDLLSPGTHINGVGSFQPDTRELDTRSVQRALVVVDSYTAALKEAGDLLIPISDGDFKRANIQAELCEVVLGKRVRYSDEEITLFKSTGHAIEDLVCAKHVYERALVYDLGSRIPL